MKKSPHRELGWSNDGGKVWLFASATSPEICLGSSKSFAIHIKNALYILHTRICRRLVVVQYIAHDHYIHFDRHISLLNIIYHCPPLHSLKKPESIKCVRCVLARVLRWHLSRQILCAFIYIQRVPQAMHLLYEL